MLLILLAMVLSPGVNLLWALHCPTNITNWDLKAKQIRCEDKNQVYHCALDQKEKPKEICYQRNFVYPGEVGCPWFLVKTDGQIVRGSPFTDCPPNLSGCPSQSHNGYYVDSLFMYPQCLIRTKERNNETDKEVQSTHDPPKTTTPFQALDPTDGKKSKLIVVFATLFAVTLIVLICVLVWHIKIIRRHLRQRKASMNRDPAESNENSPLRGRAFRNSDPEEGIEEASTAHRIMIQETYSPGIVIREQMIQLKDILTTYQIAVLKGGWGCGKSTIVQWYHEYLEHSYPNETLWAVFNCTDKLTFTESVREWQNLMYTINVTEEKENDAVIPSSTKARPLSRIIKDVLRESKSSKTIVIVFDEVSDECKGDVQDILMHTEDFSKLKCIVTSHKESIIENTDFVIEVGGFTDNEVKIHFTVDGKELKEGMAIAELLENSPIALRCAKTVMSNANLTGSEALRLFAKLLRTDLLKKINHPEKVPLVFVMEILRYTCPTEYSVLECLQFMNAFDIPIVLIQFLRATNSKSTLALQASNFVMVFRGWSFITVTNYDLDRVITIHPGVLYAIYETCDVKEKRRCLIAILKCLSWLLSKRPGPPITRERCLQLLPHAKDILNTTFKMINGDGLSLEPHEFFLLTLVCDRVIYTLGEIGLQDSAKEIARNIFNLSPFLKALNDIPNTSNNKDEIERCSRETIKTLEEMFQQEETKKKLNLEAFDFIQGKVRKTRYMKSIKREKELLDYEFQLTDAEYIQFIREGNAVPEANIGLWFVYQVLINIALTRGLEWAAGCPNGKVKPSKLKYLLFAAHLSDALQNKSMFRDMPFYCALDSKINGNTEMDLNISNELQLSSLQKTIDNLTNLMEEIRSKGYFVGCVKVAYDWDMCHEINARKQLIRIYLKMAEVSALDRETHLEKAEEEAGSLEKYLSERKEDLRESFIAQSAKQWIVYCYIRGKKFQNALKTLEHLSSYNAFNPDHKLTLYDVIDLELKCDCYEQMGEIPALETNMQKMDSLRKNVSLNRCKLQHRIGEVLLRYHDLQRLNKRAWQHS